MSCTYEILNKDEELLNSFIAFQKLKKGTFVNGELTEQLLILFLTTLAPKLSKVESTMYSLYNDAISNSSVSNTLLDKTIKSLDFIHALRIDTDGKIFKAASPTEGGKRVMVMYNEKSRLDAIEEEFIKKNPGVTFPRDLYKKELEEDRTKGIVFSKLEELIYIAINESNPSILHTAISAFVYGVSPFYEEEGTHLIKEKDDIKNPTPKSKLEATFNLWKTYKPFFPILFKDSTLFLDKTMFKHDHDYLVNLLINEITAFADIIKNNFPNRVAGKYFSNKKYNISTRIGIFGTQMSNNEEIPFIMKLVGGETSYENWDSAKKLRFDYELGFDRALLEANGISGKKMQLLLCPLNFIYGKIETFKISSLFENRNSSSAQDSGLDYNHGKITAELKEVIEPAAVELELKNLDKLTLTALNINALTNGAWTPRCDYTIDNKDALLKDIISKGKVTKSNDKSGKTYYKLSKLVGTEHDVVYCATEEELRKEIDKYIDELEKEKGHYTEKIISAFNTLNLAARSGESVDASDLFGDRIFKKELVQATFGPYLDGSWDIIDIPELTANNIIALKNKYTKIIEFITISSDDSKTTYSLLAGGLNKLGNTIVGGYLLNDVAYEIDLNMPVATAPNLEILKVITVINTIPELFKNARLGNIKFFSCKTGESLDVNLSLYKGYNIISKYAKLPNLIGDSLTSQIKRASLDESMLMRIKATLTFIPDTSRTFKNVFEKAITEYASITESLDVILEKIKSLLDMQLQLEKEYHLNSKMIREELEWSRPEIRLYALVCILLSEYLGMSFITEAEVPKYGITALNFLSGIIDLISFNRSRIDNKGRKIVGPFLGALMTGSANVPSQNLQKVYQFIDGSILKVRKLVNIQCAKIQGYTVKFYEDSGRGRIERMLMGDNYDLYHGLFEKLEDGIKLSSEFKVKNPFNMNNDLSKPQREYLINILWQINKFILPNISAKDREKSFEEVKDLEPVRDAIADGRYFQIPLKRASDLYRFRGTAYKQMPQLLVKLKIKELRDVFDLRQLNPAQREEYNSLKKSYQYIPDLYNISPATRDKFLDSQDIGYWETNLDMIAMDVAFNAAKREVFNKLLTSLRATAVAWKYGSFTTGINIDLLLEVLLDQIKITIFNEPVIGEEAEDAIKAIKTARKITSLLKIALRPGLWVKEMTVGWLRNWSIALTNVIKDSEYDFTFKDVYKALAFMVGHIVDRFGLVVNSDNDDIASFTLLNGLNNTYGIANMDFNSIVQKLKTDRYGYGAGLSKWMYWFSTNPDLYNRMTMFVALMYHDGCLEAHSMKDGVLVYDMSKDKRFTEYYTHRNEKGYTSKEFEKQKALYNVMMDEFIANGETNAEGELVKRGDDLPSAYTTRQRDSLKELSDTMYGCYDHEAKMQLEHKVVGILWFQFKTYWSGAVRRWFAPTGTLTARGHFELLKDLDGNLLFRNPIVEDGKIVGYTDPTTELIDGSEPIMIWKGDFMEGCMVSIIKTLRDCGYWCTNAVGLTSQDKLFDKNRLANCVLGIHDIFIGWLLAMLIDLIFFGESAQDHFSGGLTGGSGAGGSWTDEDLILLKGRNILVSACSEFNPDQTIPFTSWDPSMISAISKGYNSFFREVSKDNPNLANFISNNVLAVGDVIGTDYVRL